MRFIKPIFLIRLWESSNPCNQLCKVFTSEEDRKKEELQQTIQAQ
jgi:hypothetical protein